LTEIQKVLHQLSINGVEFIIIGGVAATYYGSSYVTYDLDICYARTASNLEKLVEVLNPFHPTLRGVSEDVPFKFDAKTLKAGMNFTFSTDLGNIDLLGELTGLGSYDQLFPLSVETEIFALRCRILNLDTLIEAKRKAGRPKDLAVALELEAIKELLEKKTKT
jgi:hypothetical protein